MKSYTVAEAAKKLKVSRSHIYECIKRGDIRKIDGLGRTIRISINEFKGIKFEDEFPHDPNKVQILETSLGKVRNIKGTDKFVVLDVAKALGASSTTTIAKPVNDNYISKLSADETRDLNMYRNQFGMLLISYDGLKEYVNISKNSSRVKTLLDELVPPKEIEIQEQIHIDTQETKNDKFDLQVIDTGEILGRHFRVFGDFQNPLFLAKDIAEWIEYDLSSINKMLNNVDVEEKVRKIVPTQGGQQEMWFLTEDGVYEVLMQSRKPIAKEFKKQIKIILKNIRLKGGYVANENKFVNNYFSSFSPQLKSEMIKELESKNKALVAERTKIDLLICGNEEVLEQLKKEGK
ncbi:BRO family protein [Clostridium cellulovorans]|uniref:Prophage antirepressor n=1 Tax=Clostridium cellulovorans (strain ATCC 35296 / DSM 3052 / OCM 3 / 743B) TaxID=573061 RepID=D9SWH6_CLOC7|nr:BRO family protein [Clostridium cellulovorans]ADL53258.1 prophage antirepressor [Clostridium cellulovorans 743B]